jgi:hypothetical protein
VAAAVHRREPGPGAGRIRADRELDKIREVERSGGHLRVHFRLAASPEALRDVLAVRPDVLHFACHGSDGWLMFETPEEGPHSVEATRVVRTLRGYAEHAGVRLRGIVLSMCGSREMAALFRELVDEVIAHDGRVDDRCAGMFAGALYDNLRYTPSLASAARLAADQVVDTDDACVSLADKLIVLAG